MLAASECDFAASDLLRIGAGCAAGCGPLWRVANQLAGGVAKDAFNGQLLRLDRGGEAGAFVVVLWQRHWLACGGGRNPESLAKTGLWLVLLR